MQVFATVPNLPQAAPARQNRESLRTIEPVDIVDAALVRPEIRDRLAPESPANSEIEAPQNDSENYRLNFDPEKRQIYLELLNPVTGDVIQRVPRDDLAFDFAPTQEQPVTGVNITV